MQLVCLLAVHEQHRTVTRPVWEGNLPWGQLLWHWTETSSHQLLFSRQWLRLATDSSGTAGESWEEGHWGGVGGWGVGTSSSWRQLEGAIRRQKTYQKNECAHLPPILFSLHSLCQTQQCGWTCWLWRKDFRVLHVKEGSTDESHLLWHWLNHKQLLGAVTGDEVDAHLGSTPPFHQHFCYPWMFPAPLGAEHTVQTLPHFPGVLPNWGCVWPLCCLCDLSFSRLNTLINILVFSVRCYVLGEASSESSFHISH